MCLLNPYRYRFHAHELGGLDFTLSGSYLTLCLVQSEIHSGGRGVSDEITMLVRFASPSQLGKAMLVHVNLS
jgi:hypothetical protein